MASTFPTTAVTNGTQAESLFAGRMMAAGAPNPTGGLSLIDMLCWAAGELLATGPGGTAVSVTNAITAFATGGQTNATALTTPLNRVTVCATIGDSVKLPAATAGAFYVVANDGAAGLDIFPATGGIINALAANTAIRIASGSRVAFYCMVDGTWSATATPLPYAKFTTNAGGSATASAGWLSGAAYTVMRNTANGAVSWATRTATEMFADTPNARVGDSYMLLVVSAGDNTVTLTAGSGVTLTGTMTVATATTRLFVVTFTTAIALTIQSVSIGTIA